MTTLDQAGRNLLFNEARTHNGWTDQPKVANGGSELLQQLFGEAGRHARAAVGTNALPLGASVEIELLVEVR